MPEFRDWKSLLKHLDSYVPLSLEQIGEKVKEILRDNVDTLWYQTRPSTEWYDRTYQMIESISCSTAKQVNGYWQVEIYFDIDKIIPTAGENEKWGQHQGVNGEDVSEFMPLFLEEGNFDSPLYSYDGVHAVRLTKEWINDTRYLKEQMIKILKEKGFVVK